MALLDQIVANQKTARSAQPDTTTVPAKNWLNVGYVTAAGKFVNLPLGMPIDTMKGVKVSGQNEEWIGLQTARNELLKAVQEKADSLAPGEEVEIPLIVRIRKVNDEKEVDSETNEFGMAANGISI